MHSTKYPHIFWIPEGFYIAQDKVSLEEGYVWFDEIGCLGSDTIHATIEECKEELDLYCEHLNKANNDTTTSEI